VHGVDPSRLETGPEQAMAGPTLANDAMCDRHAWIVRSSVDSMPRLRRLDRPCLQPGHDRGCDARWSIDRPSWPDGGSSCTVDRSASIPLQGHADHRSIRDLANSGDRNASAASRFALARALTGSPSPKP
jgi:hypothetical protein